MIAPAPAEQFALHANFFIYSARTHPPEIDAGRAPPRSTNLFKLCVIIPSLEYQLPDALASPLPGGG